MATVMTTSFHPSKKHNDHERWICVYPSYIDSHKTRAEGRRVPKNKAVDRPTITEICDVAIAAGFNVAKELKFYPRDGSKEEERRGRVRIQLRNEDGSPVNPAFPSRDAVFLHLGHKIPELKTRQNKSGSEPQASGSGGAAAGGKKKNKGGRR